MTKEGCAWCKWGGLAVTAASVGGLAVVGLDPLDTPGILLMSGAAVGATVGLCAFQIDRARQASWR